jgi:hypothetical protein
MKRLHLLLILMLPLASRAEGLRRVAVLVGANHGALGRTPLRYSYGDADEMAAVLVQAGEFAQADVHVLRDPQPRQILDELDGQLRALKSESGESLLLFYYSGHADSAALYPDGKALPFAELRERLESPAATVRIGIIDACSGGGWTGTKGLYPSAPFAVDVPLELTGEGSVLIASSSGLEKAHESERLLGSFFTHHLVAALRGAADPRGDGVVTLTDAFAYAKERTVRDSSAVAEPQHPSFSMNLRGRSDLPLTRVAASKTLVQLSETEGPLQLIHLGTGLVVLEVPQGKRVIKLSVPPGRYLVRRQGKGGTYAREITVEPGKAVELGESELILAPLPRSGAKEYEEPVLDAGWPIALNGRPLTLLRGMFEVQAGLLAEADTNIPASRFGGPLALVPQIRYGVTDEFMVTVAASNGVCVSAKDCERLPGKNVSGTGTWMFEPGPFFSMAAFGRVGVQEVSQIGNVFDNDPPLDSFHTALLTHATYPLSGGVTARLGGGERVSAQITLALTHAFAFSGHSSFNNVTLAGQLVLEAHPRLSFDAGAQVGASFAEDEDSFDAASNLPLVVGATWTPLRNLDVRAQFTFRDLQAHETITPADQRQFGLLLSYRPWVH